MSAVSGQQEHDIEQAALRRLNESGLQAYGFDVMVDLTNRRAVVRFKLGSDQYMPVKRQVTAGVVARRRHRSHPSVRLDPSPYARRITDAIHLALFAALAETPPTVAYEAAQESARQGAGE